MPYYACSNGGASGETCNKYVMTKTRRSFGYVYVNFNPLADGEEDTHTHTHTHAQITFPLTALSWHVVCTQAFGLLVQSAGNISNLCTM